MKKFFIIFVLFVTIVTNVFGFEPYINKNGSYVLFDENTDIVAGFVPSEKCPKGSFNYFRSCLGYNNCEVISHFTDAFDIIAFNAFNNEVIFIIPNKTTKNSLSQQEANTYINGYKPSASEFVDNLRQGVENRSIRQSFVETSLGSKSENNTLTDEIHGFTYVFENGILSDYKSLEGFSEDAIYVKENFPQVFNKILNNARLQYGTSKGVVAEYVNGQCKYFMRIDANYLRQAYNSNINYNFALLYCILYEGMGLDEFSFLVPGSELSSSINNYVIMKFGTYIFTFKDNVLIKD